MEKGQQGEDGATEDAAEEDDADEEKPLTAEQEILAGIEDEEERAMTKELFKLVEEKREKERKQDAEGGVNLENYEVEITDAEFA